MLVAFIADKGRVGSSRLALDLANVSYVCDLKIVAKRMIPLGLFGKAE